jgi:hypothetical protein
MECISTAEAKLVDQSHSNGGRDDCNLPEKYTVVSMAWDNIWQIAFNGLQLLLIHQSSSVPQRMLFL